jgi:hypothetical protein
MRFHLKKDRVAAGLCAYRAIGTRTLPEKKKAASPFGEAAS